MSSSLDARYIRHLRQRAKESGSSSSSDSYVCVLCKQNIALADKDALWRHLDERHGAEVDELSKDPNFDLQVWRDQVQARSKVTVKASRTQEADIDTASSGEFGLHRLSLDAKATLSPRRNDGASERERHGDADPGGGKKRPSSFDAQEQQNSAPQPRSGRNPRRSAQRDHSNAEQRTTPDPTSRAPGFRPHFDSQGRLLSRELWNPYNSISSSQTNYSSQIAQPPSLVPTGSDALLRNQSPLSQAQASTSITQTFPIGLPSIPGSGARHRLSPHQHEQGVLPIPAEVIAQQTSRRRGIITMPVDPRFPEMLMQPDSRPISQEQLSAEVKSIYSGLVMVEAKVIHVDKAQASAIRGAERGEGKIADDHWQALIALHRTLLLEHHDFFLASQHPSASPALQRLATKYTMPARMWKHGIHSFLELLRYRLPESLEFMISFIYTAYQMMSLLYETVPAFEDTWIECLGDLGRYRMAIEDEDIGDRETWAGVSRHWYTKAADRSPEVGRLYHHLAILARPNGLQQLYLYSRSLTSVQIFHSAQESILTLFNPVMSDSGSSFSQLSKIDSYFIKTHAVLFSKHQLHRVEPLQRGFLELLDAHIGRVTAKWREQGAYVIIANIAALFDFGTDSTLRRLFDLGFSTTQSPTPNSSAQTLAPMPEPDAATQSAFEHALDLHIRTTTLVLRRVGDKNVLTYVHILLSFLSSLASIQSFDFRICEKYVARTILQGMPWSELCSFINTLARTELMDSRYESVDFIRPEKGDARPLPEDHLTRGQVWSQKSLPNGWFEGSEVDDEERFIEHASTNRMRAERVLSLAFRMASFEQWIRYDSSTKTWSPIPVEESESGASSLHLETEDVTMIDAPDESGDLDDELDSTDVSEDDSPEMDPSNKGARQQAATPKADGSLAVPTPKLSRLKSAEAMLRPGYTVMVCDEKLLLKYQDVFELLIELKYSIVVPQNVFTKLTKSARSDAQQALRSVVKAVSMNNDVRILTSSGLDTTIEGIDKTGHLNQETSLDGTDDPEENIVHVARRASDLSVKGNPENALCLAQPAIVLSEDKSTRLRAAKDKVAALAPNVIKRILTTARARKRGSSGSQHWSSGFDVESSKSADDPDPMQQ